MKQTEYIRGLLIDIFNLGDRDEMSWKHIGHSVASILVHENWELQDDYFLPKEHMDIDEMQALDELWSDVHFAIDEMGKQKFLDSIEEIKGDDMRLMYLGEYLDAEWLSYYEPISNSGLKLKGSK